MRIHLIDLFGGSFVVSLNYKGNVIKKDITEGIPNHDKLKQRSIDLAFIDPPYGKDIIPGVLESIVKNRIMADGSYIVAESMKHDHLPDKVEGFYLAKTRLYGETKIDIYNMESR